MPTGDPNQALIPAVVRETPTSTEALIEVEVKHGNKVRRRAAVIPISVRQLTARQQQERSEQRRSEERDKEWTRQHPVRWSDPLTDTIIFGTRVAETVVHFAHNFGVTAIGTAEGISNALFSRARVLATAAERRELHALDFETVIKNPRRAQIEVRAA